MIKTKQTAQTDGGCRGALWVGGGMEWKGGISRGKLAQRMDKQGPTVYTGTIIHVL